jgi:hypothetical protein
VRVFVYCARAATSRGKALTAISGGLGWRLLLEGQGRDADHLEEFALPDRQLHPHRVLALPGQPLAEVHPVDGDAGQDVGLVLVGQQLADGDVMPLPARRPLPAGVVPWLGCRVSAVGRASPCRPAVRLLSRRAGRVACPAGPLPCWRFAAVLPLAPFCCCAVGPGRLVGDAVSLNSF